MSIYEYDQEKHMRLLSEDVYERGYHSGMEKGRKQGRKQIAEKMLLQGTFDDETILNITGITKEELAGLKKADEEKH